MRRSNLHTKLEAGRQVVGLFAPVGAEFETPGVLSWSTETGAELELVNLSDPWPSDFAEIFEVHGQPHDGEALTLLQARVSTRTNFDRTSKISSPTLALGEHVTIDDRWLCASYCPASLHEWLPDTGLSVGHLSEDRSKLIVEWNAPGRRTVVLPDGEVSLNPGADWSWSYTPGWSIETSMAFSVKLDEPLTISEHWRQYGSPLLSFAIFAADRPDDLVFESYFSPESHRQIVLLRRDRKAPRHDWSPLPGHYLFQASDLEDISAALARWFEVWRQTTPALGLLGDFIMAGNTYSAPRFLTLYTAAEGYWKNTNTGKAAWSPRQLARRAGISTELTGATDEALALLGATRKYHAHLDVRSKFSPEELVDQTYESTRRLHALLQACLMREIGMDTAAIERLIRQHYQSWPVP